MTRACLGLLAGMYALQLSSFAVLSDHLSTVFVATCILIFCRQWLLVFCFVCGVFLFYSAAERLLDSRIDPEIAGDSIVVQVEVTDFPTVREATGGRMVSFLAQPLHDSRLPAKIRLSWFNPVVTVRSGDLWELELRLQRPRGNSNPGSFDFEGWLFREQIAATGYVVNSHRNHLLGRTAASITQRIRQRFVDRVAALLDAPEQAAVLAAIVVGARHAVDADQWDRYAATGSSHLMAISGLHIGLAAIGAYYLARFLSGLVRVRSSWRNHHLLAVLVALAVALLYAQISGFAIPARRASLMLLLASLCLVCRQRPDPVAVVSSCCLIVAVANPLATMAPGFILSFAAVVILIWASLRRRLGLATMQLALLCGLLPLTAILFDRISFAALPVNLLAVPLFSFVTVPLALLGLLFDGPLQFLGDWALIAAASSVAALEYLLRLVATSNWASLSVAAISGFAWMYLCLPACWALLPPGWPGRAVAWLGLFGLVLHTPKPPATDCALVSVLDVGQGLAVVVQTRQHLVVYDSGPAYRSGGTAAQNVILPFLQSRGLRQIDRLIVSHGDLDHAGGVAVLRDALPVGQIMAGEALPGVIAKPCLAGQSWSYDGIRYTILHPDAGSALTGNNRSCVLLLEAGSFRLLLSGDIEREAEHELLRQGRLPKVHAVTVPHHGSRTSSTRPFVRALRPSIAIVSAAYGNHWKFPKEDVVARWRATGATVLNTATDGAIEMRICADSGFESITRNRVARRRIWHE